MCEREDLDTSLGELADGHRVCVLREVGLRRARVRLPGPALRIVPPEHTRLDVGLLTSGRTSDNVTPMSASSVLERIQRSADAGPARSGPPRGEVRRTPRQIRRVPGPVRSRQSQEGVSGVVTLEGDSFCQRCIEVVAGGRFVAGGRLGLGESAIRTEVEGQRKPRRPVATDRSGTPRLRPGSSAGRGRRRTRGSGVLASRPHMRRLDGRAFEQGTGSALLRSEHVGHQHRCEQVHHSGHGRHRPQRGVEKRLPSRGSSVRSRRRGHRSR